ncbi:MAG: SpoIIE family protein phosphatase, partial [Acidobacteriaceae bacterium]|nr:SpoIIE family protein phosphatase [Acidobacteriaceae bacterium]
SGYEHSGLQVGDEIAALNGEPIHGFNGIDHILFQVAPNDSLHVTVHRRANGVWNTITVPVKLHAGHPEAAHWTLLIGVGFLLPTSCLLLGFYIAFARPADPLAWITLTMLVSIGQVATFNTGFRNIWSPWREMFLVYHNFLQDLWPAGMLLFALYFPVPFNFIGKHRWLNSVFAAPIVLLSALGVYTEAMAGDHLQQIRPLVDWLDVIGNPVRILIGCYISAFFILLSIKAPSLKAPDAARRMRVMIFGCSLALTPLLLLILSEVRILPPFPFWLVVVCLMMLVFFPITLAYVIVVQRAMDVHMVIRSGVRYGLASTGLKIGRTILTVATVILSVHFAMQSHRTWVAIDIGAAGAALIAGFRWLSAKLILWMDRRFFREAYNAELVLTDLSKSVATIRDTRALLETVARRIADSLHVSRIAMFLERGNFYQPAYALGYGSLPAIQLPGNTLTVRVLKTEQSPAHVYFDDPQSWVHAAPAPEQEALQELDAQVLLPVSLDSRLLGLISLGPKKSEAPYSRADLQLLGAVASQTGLALENAELTESIRREVAQRERLNRELEIAREVQQRLFPQSLPEVCGLEFAGYCRPALGVGGDYYDFVRLEDGSLGIAIGDVSGKGIAAALMMASLQASLRGQTLTPSLTLAEMVQHVNRLVYEASAENRYATFFYAQYEPSTRILRYVNAGHNPPILWRGETGEIVRLEEGGTVVGLFRDFPYRQTSLQLEPSDILVAFTDGISEAMNSADEEFDEERLIEGIKTCNSRCATDMITSILERVDAFTAGAPQHDDMTLVVVRVQ